MNEFFKALSTLTGFMTSIDAKDCESTNLPPMRLGTLWRH